jgi:Zn-dependent peptidase ImmA (M78 family)
MEISVPYLTDSALRNSADDFLTRYHPSRLIPVPIESIVEFDLGVDIVPIPGMHRAYDIDSMLSKDLQQICVDAAVFEDFPGRYRFSLAHEVAHRQLHAAIYSQLSFSDVAEWKEAVAGGLSERDHGKLEFQAYTFAGLILVPPGLLAQRLTGAISLAEARGLPVDRESDVARSVIEGYLSKEFVVSREVIRRRMASDGLWERTNG